VDLPRISRVGSFVGTNAFIAFSGNTGESTGAHLHTGIFFSDPAKDPYAKRLQMQGNLALQPPRKNPDSNFFLFDPVLFW